MILIIYAPPRYGKTILMTHFANVVAFDRPRTRAMESEIQLKQASGFENLKTIPKHCVSANYDMVLRKFGYSPRYNRRINPYKLGFKNPFVETHFNIPHELICIDEAQKYFNSRMALYYPDWQSRYFEQHGHNDLDFILATQRPMLIDPNIRDLSVFLEVMELETKFNDFGIPNKFNWDLRFIKDSMAWDCYMQSGKKDKDCYKSIELQATENLYNCYDHQHCKPKFYDGHLNQDFDYIEAEPTIENYEGYIKYLLENDDELPKNFYIKRKAAA